MLTLTYFGSAAMEGAAPSGSSGAPAPAGVTRTDVRDGGLYGELYRPEGAKGALPAVILLGGSEGGIDVISAMAPSFAKQGFATLALAYWGEKGLPQTLENIPLEYFDAAATWLQTQPGVDADAIGVLGWSRGSEAAMLLGTRNPKIHAVAAVAPSGIVWSGINYGAGKPKSAWTAGGEGLPYMNPDASAYDPKGTLAPMFLKALPQAQSHPQAAIPVEKIGGPILLISGTDDGIWPSATFAGRIAERLKAANFKYNVENLVYPDAGHAVFVGAPDSPMAAAVGMPNAAMGGSLQANQAAWEDNWPRTLAFFNAALKEKSQ
jgi:hypothetical protein